MDDIITIFNEYLTQFHSIDIAETEFKKSIHEDPQLRATYRSWCEEVGSTERNGFFDYCQEYMASQNDVWNTLNDYDNEE